MTTAAVLTIGTEITRGEIVDTNAAWIAGELTTLGFDVAAADTVDDDDDRIVRAVRRLAAENGVLVATGGLGPTTDDRTAACAARAFGVRLVRHEPSLDAIRARFAALGRPMSPTNEKQADLPEGADALPNAEGTAPGFALSDGACRAFFLPGVPREMRRMFRDAVAPRVAPLAPRRAHVVRLHTFGLPESQVGESLGGVERDFPGVVLGYRAHFPEVEVKVQGRADEPDLARLAAEAAAVEARRRLGKAVYAEGDETFVGAVARAVRSRGWKIALAESCTGGLAAQMLTSEPASDYVLGAVVAYDDRVKQALLGVAPATLAARGAVSAEVAREMAEGARRAIGADAAVAITGIAGPTGATPDKPVGLVHWAVATPSRTEARERIFPGDRDRVRLVSAYAALWLLREMAARG